MSRIIHSAPRARPNTETYPIADPLRNTEAHADATDGVLELVLRTESYEWRFVSVEGETFADSGSARCN